MIIELIRRKPIPPEKEGMVHAIGMLLLFALIIFVSFNDIMKLFH
jgi:regulator of sigma E protease